MGRQTSYDLRFFRFAQLSDHYVRQSRKRRQVTERQGGPTIEIPKRKIARKRKFKLGKHHCPRCHDAQIRRHIDGVWRWVCQSCDLQGDPE